jgi:prepilin-type N-terminal cleavage/methylation domain-containing protein
MQATPTPATAASPGSSRSEQGNLAAFGAILPRPLGPLRRNGTMPNNARAGFTLIEMLVVIAIISLLAVAIVPAVLGARESANKAADQANMREIWKMVFDYENRKKAYPPGGGHKFLLGPWIDQTIPERTEKIRDRYFTPGLQDARLLELREMDVTQIWRSRDEVSSLDTNYAGPLATVYGQLRKDSSAWMANDNEFGPAFVDGTIHVLRGDGSVTSLERMVLMEKFGWPQDDPDYVYPVGTDSPHVLLQKLER